MTQDEIPRDEARYATFPRRLNALTTDLVFLVGVTVLVFAVSPLAENMPVLRLLLAFGWWATLVLYEPLTVAFYGGTLGHRLMNLRVVDDLTGGNPSVPKSIGRYLIKGFLGVLSFFSMSFSRKHQALHDMMTDSTVQIRDPARAARHHYVLAKPTAPPP